MKIISIFFFTCCLVIISCSQNESPDKQLTPYEYLLAKLQEHGLEPTAEVEQARKNEQFLHYLDSLGYEGIDQLVLSWSSMSESLKKETEFWNEVQQTPEWQEYLEARKKAKTVEDFEKLLERFPEICRHSGLDKVVEEMKRDQKIKP